MTAQIKKSLVSIACVFVCCLGFTWYYPMDVHLPHTYVKPLPLLKNVLTKTQIPHRHNATDFKPVNGHGMYTLHNICIELAPGSKQVPLTPNETVPAKRFVAYNAHTYGTRSLTVAASHNSHFKKWDILQVKEPIPSSHTYITDHPAYFTSPSSFGNLHHFWVDLYVGLYGSLKITNQLGVSDGSYLYFREYNEGIGNWFIYNRYYNRDLYKDFLFALGIRPGFGMFFNETVNTCFRNAVFGWAPTATADVVDYLATKLPFESNKCKPKQIVIIQRSKRLILNVNQLRQAAIQLGYNNTDVVDFADMTLLDQYQLTRCTRIMVGINGAALQWAVFMKPGSGLMELSFAKPNFHQHYKFMKGYRKFVYDGYDASRVIPDWHALGNGYTKEQKQDIISGKTKFSTWKLADGEFEVNGFRKTLQNMTDKVFK